MNWQFHKQQLSTVTDKQTDLGKLFDWLKKFYWSHVQLEIEKTHIKWASKLYQLQYSSQKTNREVHIVPPPHPMGQVGLKVFQKEGGTQEAAIYNKQGT